MKIVVTGASSGLGKAISNFYQAQGHQVLKLTRQTDLRDWSIRQNLYQQIKDYDIFVSVAKPDFVQTELLYELYNHWKDKKACIISIGSGIVSRDHWGDTIEMMRYHTQKKALAHAVEQLKRLNKTCKLIIINPDHLYYNNNIDYDLLDNWCDDNKELLNGC